MLIRLFGLTLMACLLASTVGQAGPISVTIRENNDGAFVSDTVTIRVLDCNGTAVTFKDSSGANVTSVTTNTGIYSLTVVGANLCTADKKCTLSFQRGMATPVLVQKVNGVSTATLSIHVVLPPARVVEEVVCVCPPVCCKPVHCGFFRRGLFCR